MRKPCWLLLISIALTCRLSLGQTQRVTFLLTASPPQLTADGKSTATITVRVDDPTVPEGTTVHFTSSLEDTVIDPQQTLKRGVARATLRAGRTAGVTIVTAFFGTSRQSIEVQILPVGVPVSRETQAIHLEGDYVAYSPTHRFVAGGGRMRLVTRGWEIVSDVRLDLWLDQEVCVAEGQPGENKVTLSNGQKTIRGDRLIADLSQQMAILIQVTPRPQRIVVKGISLQEQVDDRETDIAEPLAPTDINIQWIRGKSLDYYPNERLIIRRAQIYTRGAKVVSLPIYVENLSGYAASRGFTPGSPLQGLSLTAYGGLQLDSPVYYRADRTGTGAVRLQYFGRGFGYLRPGPTLSIEEQYVLGDRGQMEGAFLLEQITRGDWGIRWQHFHRFGAGQATLFVDMPRHKDLFARLGFHSSGDRLGYGVEANYDKPKGFPSSHGIRAFAYMPGGPIGRTGLTYSLAGALSYQPNSPGLPQWSWAADWNLNLPTYQSRALGQLTGQVGLSLVGLGGNWSFPWQVSGSLSRSLGRMGTLGISYNLDRGRNLWGIRNRVSETLSTYLWLTPGKRWRIMGNASLYLKGGGKYASLYAVHQLKRGWSLAVDLTHQGYSGFTFTDYGLRLAREIGGGLEVSLNWYRSRRRPYLEVGMARF
ncbi:MAG: Ig-like domain-containing protein [Armatimonadetes bacterium]|nr:Ig-like domain-containing protein [Armatimonadota bacterium]MDW8121512.1 Ig-like domain-containing protein [Armatimonadota bacterium]